MEWLTRIQDALKTAERRELLMYAGGFFGILALAMGLLLYFHQSRVSFYKKELKKMDSLRIQTKQLLTQYKRVKAQQATVEELLGQNKDFRIGQAFQALVQKTGLSGYIKDPTPPSTHEVISGKQEVQISSLLVGISMKQVTDLLAQIAATPQLYVKELTIKKTPQARSVDLDITIATLEPTET